MTISAEPGLLVSVPGEFTNSPRREAVVLVFTPTAWARGGTEHGLQIVRLFAIDDLLAQGDRVAVVSHSVRSQDPAFDGAVARGLEVTIYDDELPSIRVAESDGTLVVEGSAVTERNDSLEVSLSADPGGAVTLELRPSDDRVELSGPAGRFATIKPRAPGVAGVYRLVLGTGSSWEGVEITVHAADDALVRDPHRTRIDVVVVPALSVASFAAAAPAHVEALVLDDDTPGLVVLEDGGSTRVVAGDTVAGPGPSDQYELRLTSAPSGTVTASSRPTARSTSRSRPRRVPADRQSRKRPVQRRGRLRRCRGDADAHRRLELVRRRLRRGPARRRSLELHRAQDRSRSPALRQAAPTS